MDQIIIPVTDLQLVDNPENRCLCVLVLDVSGSMQGRPIAELNCGLVDLKNELMADSLAKKRVELAIVTFGPVTELQSCVSAETFLPPSLDVQGNTPMGAALVKAVEIVETRKAAYKQAGIKYYRPWIMLITDGGPTDRNEQVWSDAITKIRDGLQKKAFAFFPVGVDGADMQILASISPTEPIKLKGLQFRELFKWLSSSLKSVSQSRPDEQVALVNPTAPGGWGHV
jgi:uncharacterized protein YegL